MKYERISKVSKEVVTANQKQCYKVI